MNEQCQNCEHIAQRDAVIEQQQSTLSGILNDSQDILYRYNFETGQYDYLSGNIEQITGHTCGEIKSVGVSHLLESLHPDDKASFMEVYGRLVDNTLETSNLTLEYRTRHKDGHYIHRSDNISIVRNESGKIVAVVGNARDITDHRITEQALKISQERYKRLAEAAFEGVMIHEQGIILDANQQFCDMLGYEADEIKGKNGMELIAPQSREMVKQYIVSGFEGPYEAFGLRKDGTEIPTEVRVRTVNDGQKILRIAAFRDLTQQKKLQQRLSESEKKYRELYENAQVALFRTALDGTLLDCNQAARRFFGYPVNESLPTTFSVTDSYVDKNRRKQFIDKLKKHKKVQHFDAELKKSDGRCFWVSISAELNSEHGYIEGALTDITIQKLLTKTEKKILTQLLQGKTNKEIAAETNRSIRTIEDHRAHIMQKLGVHNLIDLAKKGLSSNLTLEK